MRMVPLSSRRVTSSSSELDKGDSTWIVRRGLADNACVSIKISGGAVPNVVGTTPLKLENHYLLNPVHSSRMTDLLKEEPQFLRS
jgi:hypothetical protein